MNKTAHHTPYSDRNNGCQFAMEDHLLQLMEAARAAGWTLEDAAVAITAGYYSAPRLAAKRR